MKKYVNILPVIIFLFTIAIAISANAMDSKRQSLALVQGYIKTGPAGTICQVSILCSDSGGQLCKVGSTQVWGKASNGQCILEVYKAPE